MSNDFLLYLIRHGESANNALPETQRVSDPSLTELGFLQAEKLGLRLRDYVNEGNRIDHIITSPFLRTMQTIKPAAKYLAMKPEIRTELYEAGGCFDGYLPNELIGRPGMTANQIAQQFPEMVIPDTIDEKGWYKNRPFETWNMATERATQQAQKLKDEFIGRDIVVACTIHADLIGLLLGALCPHEPHLTRVMVSNTSITKLRFQPDKPDQPDVVFFNDAYHLAPEEVSH